MARKNGEFEMMSSKSRKGFARRVWSVWPASRTSAGTRAQLSLAHVHGSTKARDWSLVGLVVGRFGRPATKSPGVLVSYAFENGSCCGLGIVHRAYHVLEEYTVLLRDGSKEEVNLGVQEWCPAELGSRSTFWSTGKLKDININQTSSSPQGSLVALKTIGNMNTQCFCGVRD